MDKGERNAVGPNSGETVDQSVPGLRRPTTPATVGRKPKARPCPSQHKTGGGSGPGPDIEIEREALDTSSPSAKRDAVELDDKAISEILDFFRLLDQWDREGSHANQVM